MAKEIRYNKEDIEDTLEFCVGNQADLVIIYDILDNLNNKLTDSENILKQNLVLSSLTVTIMQLIDKCITRNRHIKESLLLGG